MNRLASEQRIVIRSCEGLDELQACVQMQINIWGYDPTDVIPLKAFLIAQQIGGQVLGAFDTELRGASPTGNAEALVGFVQAWPGVRQSTRQSGQQGQQEEQNTPQPYLHSHMLAVQEEYCNQGIGLRLKLAQRAEALARGIRRIEWTFDPLEIKNAFFNIHKLGARCRRYEANFYGVSSSRLQAGLPTDRLFAEWELNSPDVCQKVELAGVSKNKIAEPIIERVGQQVQITEQVKERIVIPACMDEWKQHQPERALAVQQENRQKFHQVFSRGLIVVGFSRDQEGNGIFELGFERDK